MVGRDAELGAIVDAFERSVAERDLPAHHASSARRRREVAPRPGSPRARSVIGRSSCADAVFPYGEGITYWPVARPSAERPRSPTSTHRRRLRRRIAALLDGVERSDRYRGWVAELIGLGEGRGLAEEGSGPSVDSSKASRGAQPLVLVFDDIHWGEETFLDLLALRRGMDERRVRSRALPGQEGAARPPSWVGGFSSPTSWPSRLSVTRECESLLRGLLGHREVPRAVTEAIAGDRRGQSAVRRELLAMLIDDGLARAGGRTGRSSPDLASRRGAADRAGASRPRGWNTSMERTTRTRGRVGRRRGVRMERRRRARRRRSCGPISAGS